MCKHSRLAAQAKPWQAAIGRHTRPPANTAWAPLPSTEHTATREVALACPPAERWAHRGGTPGVARCAPAALWPLQTAAWGPCSGNRGGGGAAANRRQQQRRAADALYSLADAELHATTQRAAYPLTRRDHPGAAHARQLPWKRCRRALPQSTSANIGGPQTAHMRASSCSRGAAAAWPRIESHWMKAFKWSGDMRTSCMAVEGIEAF